MRMGEVVETGKHKTLLAKERYYAILVQSQMTTNENEEVQEAVYDDEKLPLHDEGSRRDSERRLVEVIKKDNVELNTKEKEELISKMMSQTRKRLFSLLFHKKGVMIAGSLAAVCNRAVFPINGILLAMSIDSLSDPSMFVVADQGSFLACMFLVITVQPDWPNSFKTIFLQVLEELFAKSLEKQNLLNILECMRDSMITQIIPLELYYKAIFRHNKTQQSCIDHDQCFSLILS